MVTLHYTPNSTGENMSEIVKSVNKNFFKLFDTIDLITMNDDPQPECVYLCAYDEHIPKESHIIIDKSLAHIKKVLNTIFDKTTITDVWLFKCTSFEDAYKTALDMKEGCENDAELCYEPENN